ncbi:MAG: gamma-glutamyl-gamma-aminobutyrate hydrolase family protein [Pseudobdellovibrionaceae bacterium]|jgi:putative glutamine amidotransferase|nr:gamma-glutamyl-gamma-aminobutyrate hydrolase family protein [Pseudobdellovibrionaceae bacterium]
MSRLPVIGICTSVTKEPNGAAGWDVLRYSVKEQYLLSVIEPFSCVPLFLPSVGRRGKASLDDVIGQWLDMIDGVVLTGAVSNMNPARYGSDYVEEPDKFDRDRDDTNLELIPRIIRQAVPLLAICRGFQEMNVAYGGSLYPRLHEIDGRFDHRAPKVAISEQDEFRDVHAVEIAEGGLLADICLQAGIGRHHRINSLHEQAIHRPGDALRIEALAEDGTIEAATAADATTFCLGVQWHPEWGRETNPLNRAIFDSFYQAVVQKAER